LPLEAKPNKEDPRFRLRREHQQKQAFDQTGPTEERDQDRQRAARPHIVRENDGQPGGHSQETRDEKQRRVSKDRLHCFHGRLRVRQNSQRDGDAVETE